MTDAPTLFVSQADGLFSLNANTTFALGYVLADNALALLHPVFAASISAATQVTVTDSPVLRVAEANTLLVTDHAVFPFGYTLSDTGSALVAASAATVHGALAVTATDALLVTQAATLRAELGASASINYFLVDTAAHLAAATPALVSAASAVTVSDTASVAQATIIHSEAPAAHYSVTDASTVLATALTTGNASLVTVEHASTLAVTDASGVLTVNANQFSNLLLGPVLLAANDTITIDGLDVNVNLGTLHAFGGDVASTQSLTLGGVRNGSYTVDMGTSGETAIFMDGTGVQHIVASSSTKEKFSVGITNTGGSFITNLDIADSIDTIGSRTPALVDPSVASAALVNGVGKWSYTGGVLTWWDQGINAADHLTLTLVGTAHGLTLDNNHHSFTVI